VAPSPFSTEPDRRERLGLASTEAFLPKHEAGLCRGEAEPHFFLAGRSGADRLAGAIRRGESRPDSDAQVRRQVAGLVEQNRPATAVGPARHHVVAAGSLVPTDRERDILFEDTASCPYFQKHPHGDLVCGGGLGRWRAVLLAGS
jgi:hypothetical protein